MASGKMGGRQERHGVNALGVRPSLFWLALTLVSLVFTYFVGRALFAPKTPTRPWLAIFLVVTGGVAHAIDHARLLRPPPWHSEGKAGWSSPYLPTQGKPYASRHARMRV